MPCAALLSPDTLFSLASVAVMPLYGMMICSPRAKLARGRAAACRRRSWRLTFAPVRAQTRRVLNSDALWLALAGVYAAALVQSWRSDTLGLMFSLAPTPALPQLTNIAAMFTRPAAAAASWVHLLALDLFVARHVFRDAARRRVPAAHSLVLCMMFGPTGLLCHAATVAAAEYMRRRRREAGAAAAVTTRGGQP